MTKILHILILIFLITSCSKNSCRLNDGKYKVVYDNEFSVFYYNVESDSIEQIYDDQRHISELEWISDNEFFLDDLPSHLTYKDDLDKQVYTYDKPFFRLIKCRMDTIYFQLMRNQNSNVNSGKFIKVD